MDATEYQKLKDQRKITSFFDLPGRLQNELKDFVRYFNPTIIKIKGSYQQGSWVNDLNSSFAQIRASQGKELRISDLDIYADPNKKPPFKYKSIDANLVNTGIVIFSNGKFT